MTIQLPIHIDSTMMACCRSCMRKFRNEFCLGLRPPGVNIHLHAGGCFALAIEETYKGIYQMGLPLNDALARAYFFFDQAWGDVKPPENRKRPIAKTKDRMWDAVWLDKPTNEEKGYFNVYSPFTDHIQPFYDTNGKPTFEYTFAVPLEPATTDAYKAHRMFPLHPSGSPFIYVGRLDRLGSSNNRIVWCDEKTDGSTPDERWNEKWVLRSQFLGYTWALRQCGISVDYGFVRGISILKEKIHHIESPPLNYSQVLIDRWHEQLRRDLWRIRRAYDEDYWDFNLSESCTAYGSCIFIDSCQSATPDAWNSNFQIRHWNPLAKDPVDNAKVV